MPRADFSSPGSDMGALVGVAALLTREAIALSQEAIPGDRILPVLQRAATQARELEAAVAEDRANAQTLTWALELAAVTLTEARREVAAARTI